MWSISFRLSADRPIRFLSVVAKREEKCSFFERRSLANNQCYYCGILTKLKPFQLKNWKNALCKKQKTTTNNPPPRQQQQQQQHVLLAWLGQKSALAFELDSMQPCSPDVINSHQSCLNAADRSLIQHFPAVSFPDGYEKWIQEVLWFWKHLIWHVRSKKAWWAVKVIVNLCWTQRTAMDMTISCH